MLDNLLFFVVILFQVDFSIADPLVQLPNGLILGREATTFANKSYFAFEKIPFATPPVGALRFKAPQPAQNWDGTLNATYLDVSCFQSQQNPSDSEDCLFINVFTPELPVDEDNVSLPVMFYIHGGAFVQGSSMAAPPDLFVNNDVVLVTINYRLGPFGFLSTQDDVIPGNNGLKDQRFAIHWANENIHLFGGNPDQITIFGQSAGSASCAYQLLNKNSEGLFRGAILESGSFLSPWSMQRNARSIAFGTAALLNSTIGSSNDSQALLQLLQSIDAEELNSISGEYSNLVTPPWSFDVSQGVLWGPVIEVKNPDAFITKKMFGLLQAGNVLAVPTLMGFNSEENLAFNQDPDIFKSWAEAWDEDLNLIVPNDMQIVDESEHAKMAASIREIYTGGEPFADNLGGGIRYSSDTSFTRPIIKHAEMLSKYAKTYFYQFSYDGLFGNISVHYDGAESVGHSEDIRSIFCSGNGCDDGIYPEDDLITRNRLIKLWTDFAKYQNPTPEPSDNLQNITWPILSTDEGDFLYLDINKDLQIKNHPKNDTYSKWTDLYDSLGYSDFDTY
ncbi:carboxylic ester hydrolase-like [Tenebrio molitor]|uniref:carboxylic ester hydrolase-like n=1 Tax=Tenebrio molitor TaxID=7067 RepID=UPI0036247718